MLTRVRGFVFLALCLSPFVATTAAAQPAFDIDPRVRPRPDGTYFLPAPFGGDAMLQLGPVGATPSLVVPAGGAGCQMGYLSCTPHATCLGEGPCCPTVVTPGLGFLVGTPPLGDAGCALVHLGLTPGGECIGENPDVELLLSFLAGGISGSEEVSDFEACFVCTLSLWFHFARLGPFPEGCFDGDIGQCDEPILGELGAGSPRGGGVGDLPGTLRLLRDQVLAGSTAGQRWIALYAEHSPAVVRAVPSRPWLVWQLADALVAWLPALAALATGQGAPTITQAMIDDLQAIVTELEGAVPAATAAAIRDERDRLGLAGYVGLSTTQARARFEGAGGGPPAGCGDGFAGADCALAELLPDDLCGDDPVQASLLALLESRVGRARELLQRAEGAPKPGKRRKLVRKGAKQLVVLKRRARKARDTSEACRATLQQQLESRRQRVAALAS